MPMREGAMVREDSAIGGEKRNPRLNWRKVAAMFAMGMIVLLIAAACEGGDQESGNGGQNGPTPLPTRAPTRPAVAPQIATPVPFTPTPGEADEDGGRRIRARRNRRNGMRRWRCCWMRW